MSIFSLLKLSLLFMRGLFLLSFVYICYNVNMTIIDRCVKAKALFHSFLIDASGLDVVDQHRVDVARLKRREIRSLEDEIDLVVFKAKFSHVIKDRKILLLYLACYMYFREEADSVFCHYVEDSYSVVQVWLINDIDGMMENTGSFIRFKEEVRKMVIHLNGWEVRNDSKE